MSTDTSVSAAVAADSAAMHASLTRLTSKPKWLVRMHQVAQTSLSSCVSPDDPLSWSKASITVPAGSDS